MRDLRNIEATDFALTLVIEAGESIVIDYGYDAARLDESRVIALHHALSACLDAFAADADAPLGAISSPPNMRGSMRRRTHGAMCKTRRCTGNSNAWHSARRMRSRSKWPLTMAPCIA